MTLKTVERARFLGGNEVEQLISDLYMEFDYNMEFDKNRVLLSEYSMIAWFLRTYFYLPMSAIQSYMEIKGDGKGRAANKLINSHMNSCSESPESLDGRNYDKLQVMKSLVTNFYGAGGNKPLDLCNEDEEDCLLYMAHLELSGMADRGKSQGGGDLTYKLTPSEPTVITLQDIIIQHNQFGVSIEDLARNWTLISNQ